MITKEEIVRKANEFGFQDVGFTSAEPFPSQRKVLEERREYYQWAFDAGLDLMAGTDPQTILPEAKSIIVVMEVYFRESYPASMESHFGRCYLDDDRVTRDRLGNRIKGFRDYLRASGMRTKIPFHLPHRLAAARAGMGTFGKNCLFYTRQVAHQSSWVLPIAVVVDAVLEPDSPTLEVGCPDWCKNTCIIACPTGALLGPRKIDPRKCISYLTYFGDGITPRELREPMGLWVYGCDRCQNVCPRNAAWLAKELPVNQKVVSMVPDFRLDKLLHMDIPYFNTRVWPHMFYMSEKDIWRWKMNVARAMGNSLEPKYIPELVRAFGENEDERVLGMVAWALGRIGGKDAAQALQGLPQKGSELVAEEVTLALEETGVSR